MSIHDEIKELKEKLSELENRVEVSENENIDHGQNENVEETFTENLSKTISSAKKEFDDKVKPSLFNVFGSIKKAVKQVASDVKSETRVVKDKFSSNDEK